MKKTVKILALVMVAAMLCCVLASCGNTLKGTYKSDSFLGIADVSYTFDGDTVSIKGAANLGFFTTETDALEGTYKIEDGKIVFTFGETVKECSFEKGEDYIKIDGSTYTLVK